MKRYYRLIINWLQRNDEQDVLTAARTLFPQNY